MAFADKLYSENVGSWELMAWSKNNHFCALKQTIGDKTLAIRQTTANGYTIVITDPQVRFLNGDASVEISFDGVYFGTFTEFTYAKWPNQVFIEIGFDSSFMSQVILAHNIHVVSQDVNYKLNLIGTEVLGDKLQQCVDTFGF